jgi:c(7)-type cytochrome triheme protein
MKHSRIAATIVAVAFLALALASVIIAAGPTKDLVYPGKTLGDVVFKHSTHTEGDKKMVCKDCHPAPFKYKQGTSGMTMDAINKGEYCGKCHKDGGTAFDAKVQDNCGKCHTAKCEPTPAPK